uniref:aurora kinase A and ninein-interacting protein n=1 Tax=Jaculus jaculus TaxID=51337 RepID=UPI001E1B0B2B|nr:aurora kinase A and ninein-interacting protein [Jaculus jaculus]
MRRRSQDEEACGVWLDAAKLKRRKVQTLLLKPGTKLHTLFAGERKPSISLPQRKTPSAGTRQTSITSFITLRSGMTSGDNQKSTPSHRESQTNKEPQKDASQVQCLEQHLGNDCLALPLATSTPADIQEAGLSSQSLQISDNHSFRTPVLIVPSLSQSDILVCAGESNSFTQDLEYSCLLGQRDSSRKREWLHGSKTNCLGIDRHRKSPGRQCHLPLDKAELERKVSAKENKQAPVRLQTYRESQSRKNTLSVKQRPCPLPLFSLDSPKNDKDSWSQLFTEDSQGQQVIAHSSRGPFHDVTNAWKQDLGQFSESQDELTQLHLQPDLLFTQDSEGNQVIRHQF